MQESEHNLQFEQCMVAVHSGQIFVTVGLFMYVWQASSAWPVAGEDRQGGRKQGPVLGHVQ
jgi:hypothetical protein